MTFTVSGADGAFHLIAAICFLVGAILAGMTRFGPGHRAVMVLLLGGLFFWVLTTLIR